MEILILVVFGIAAFLLVPKLFADEKTKLFRRVWSTELGRSNNYKSDRQFDAVKRLLQIYGIEQRSEGEALHGKIASLMTDALVFDLKHPRNLGIEVTKVLARCIRVRLPALGNSSEQYLSSED